MIPVEKYSICSALNVEYTRQSNTYTLLRNSQRVGPFIISTGGAPSLLFQRMGPSLLFQRVGPLLYYFNRWGPFFIISSGGPLLYYFKGWGPFFIISTDWVFFIISTCAWSVPFFIISRDALGPAHLFSPFVFY